MKAKQIESGQRKKIEKRNKVKKKVEKTGNIDLLEAKTYRFV